MFVFLKKGTHVHLTGPKVWSSGPEIGTLFQTFCELHFLTATFLCLQLQCTLFAEWEYVTEFSPKTFCFHKKYFVGAQTFAWPFSLLDNALRLLVKRFASCLIN